MFCKQYNSCHSISETVKMFCVRNYTTLSLTQAQFRYNDSIFNFNQCFCHSSVIFVFICFIFHNLNYSILCSYKPRYGFISFPPPTLKINIAILCVPLQTCAQYWPAGDEALVGPFVIDVSAEEREGDINIRTFLLSNTHTAVSSSQFIIITFTFRFILQG